MATLTINIPDAAVPRMAEALCVSTGREVSAANAKAAVLDYIKQTVRAYERNQAVTSAVESADSTADVPLS